jgi:hypothetical protein
MEVIFAGPPKGKVCYFCFMPKARRGRPPADPATVFRNRVPVYLTDDGLLAARLKAGRTGKSLSDWIRSLIERAR